MWLKCACSLLLLKSESISVYCTTLSQTKTMNSSNKKAKIISQLNNIKDLPDAALIHTASYLSETSRILLSVALTASSDEWQHTNWTLQPTEASKIILSDKSLNNTNISNGCIELKGSGKKKLFKLSDADIGGVLACIGAVHTIKSVKLTHCYGCTGRGLEPLRDSVSIEVLDLSLRGIQPPETETLISDEVVFPILNSIIDMDDTRLRFIQFPKHWRDNSERSPLLVTMNYNQIMSSHSFSCPVKKYDDDEYTQCIGTCGLSCQPTQETPWINESWEKFGKPNFQCGRCQALICNRCHEEEFFSDEYVGDCCFKCGNMFCSKCAVTCMGSEFDDCGICCDDCFGEPDVHCNGPCGEPCCSDCVSDYLTICDLCKTVKCYHCDELAGKCATCDKATCGSCKPGEYSSSTPLFLNIYILHCYFLSSGQWCTVLLVTSNTATIAEAFTFVLILVALPKTVGTVAT